jgi:hypothetical protein
MVTTCEESEECIRIAHTPKKPNTIDISGTTGELEKLWKTSDGINGIQEVGGSTPPGSIT